MEDHPEPNEAWLQYFRRKRRFFDLILLAWSEIEFHINQIVTNQLGLSHADWKDKKAKILLELNFQTKLDFLKENGVITKDEYNTFKRFQDNRNKLFHGKEQPVFLILAMRRKMKSWIML